MKNLVNALIYPQHNQVERYILGNKTLARQSKIIVLSIGAVNVPHRSMELLPPVIKRLISVQLLNQCHFLKMMMPADSSNSQVQDCDCSCEDNGENSATYSHHAEGNQ